MGRGMQFSDKFRFKWVQTAAEVNFIKFVEGRNIVNHFANAKIFTDKVLCIELLESLNRSLLSARIKSDIYQETKQFLPETYRLDQVADLVSFLKSADDGLWLVKNSQSN